MLADAVSRKKVDNPIVSIIETDSLVARLFDEEIFISGLQYGSVN
jgi:hypothetical protein